MPKRVERLAPAAMIAGILFCQDAGSVAPWSACLQRAGSARFDHQQTSTSQAALVAGALEEMRHRMSGPPRAVLSQPERRILQARWVTSALCQEIAACNSHRDRLLIKRLFFLLGIIKDSRIAPFLRHYWPHHNFLGLESWLAGWHYQLGYYSTHTEEWARMAADWSDFFGWLLEQNLSPKARRMTLEVVDKWLFDAVTTKALEKLRGKTHLAVEDTIIVECALMRRGRAPTAALKQAIGQLAAQAPREVLYYASQFPIKEFVPICVQLAEGGQYAESANNVLRKLTFVSRPAEGWAAFYARHGNETRAEWWAAQESRLAERLAAGDYDAISTFFRNHCLPGDPVLLEWLKKCALHACLQEDVARLLRPTMAPQERKLIKEIVCVLKSSARIDARIDRILREQQLLPVPWAESLEAIGAGSTP